jgi:uncharacterized protein (DUF58 family)
VLPTAFNSGVNLLYLLGSVLLAYMLVAVVQGLINMRGIYGEILGPLVFEEGQDIRFQARWENRGRGTGFDLHIHPRLSKGLPAPVAKLGRLEGGQEEQRTSQGQTLPRGVYPFTQVVVESPFPIGFMRTQRRMQYPKDPEELIILPRMLAVDFQQAFGADQTLEGEDILVHGTQGGSNYYGVRPYVRGDPLKTIHWKATARTGRILVKEFQQPLQARYYLFLDLDSTQLEGEGEEANLEYLIRLAASLGRHLARGRALYQFLWWDASKERVQISDCYGTGGDEDAARRTLAGLHYHKGSHLQDMAREAVQALQPGNRLVFFIPRDQHTVPEGVAGAGYPSKAIFLVQTASSSPVGPPPPSDETGLAADVDLYRYSIAEDRLDHERG